MKLRNVIATLLLFVGAQAWAQMPDMTVPVDTAVRIGKLSNGLTYSTGLSTVPTSTLRRK